MKKNIIQLSTLSIILIILSLVGFSMYGAPGNGGIENPILGGIGMLCFFIMSIVLLPVMFVLSIFGLPESSFNIILAIVIGAIVWSSIIVNITSIIHKHIKNTANQRVD